MLCCRAAQRFHSPHAPQLVSYLSIQVVLLGVLSFVVFFLDCKELATRLGEAEIQPERWRAAARSDVGLSHGQRAMRAACSRPNPPCRLLPAPAAKHGWFASRPGRPALVLLVSSPAQPCPSPVPSLPIPFLL